MVCMVSILTLRPWHHHSHRNEARAPSTRDRLFQAAVSSRVNRRYERKVRADDGATDSAPKATGKATHSIGRGVIALRPANVTFSIENSSGEARLLGQD